MENPTVALVTGAGVSVAAGLPTFRSEGGIWSDDNFLRMSKAQHYGNYLPQLVPRWWKLTQAAQEVTPTLFHKRVAEEGWPVVTQNVDNLHQRAGSTEVVEVHGTFSTWRCLRCKKSFLPALQCPSCGKGRVRPDMVLFGERLKQGKQALALLKRADVVAFVGTSGNVFPVAGWPFEVKRAILVDPQPWENMGGFTHHFRMTSDEWAREDFPLTS